MSNVFDIQKYRPKKKSNVGRNIMLLLTALTLLGIVAAPVIIIMAVV